MNNLVSSLINYPVKMKNEMVVQQPLRLFLGWKESTMQQDCVSKVIVSLSNRNVDNLCFLWNYLSWKFYSFAPRLVIIDLMFDLLWFRVDIILKQSLFAIWTNFMVVLHYAIMIMIDFKNILRLNWEIYGLPKISRLKTMEAGFNYISS